MSTATLARATVSAPLVLDVKGNSLDDGPGIRSVVFLKGCPMSCVWCHNPESRRRSAELSFDAAACIGCDRCTPACPTGALSLSGSVVEIDRPACTQCFACVGACPAGALTRVGEPRTVEDLMAIVRRDKPFFDASGGGVTFSGGEATLHMEFLGELAAACHAEGIHTLLETCGYFRWDRFAELVLSHLDTIYYDLKLFDEADHLEYCGVPNGPVLQNFARLAELARRGEIDLLPRIPLVPGITATEANVAAIADFLLEHGIRRVRLLDYNPTWVGKLDKIGVRSAHAESSPLRSWLPTGVAADLAAHLHARGITT